MDIPGYKVERLLAEGGMASVYLAIQKSLDRRVALKLLKKFDRPEQSERFINEGRIIASLNHRNIITIHDIGVSGDQHYISMEYLEGGDLEARIRAGMTPAAAIDLLKTLGECLTFVHEKGIVHRDIKPANILFRKDGTPILTDFGIAKQLEQDTRLTRDGTAMGSPDYLSPEQAECKPLDGRTDIYGLGIVLYEMLTGHKPYQGGSYIETVMAHITQPIPSLPCDLERYQVLLERMIAKDPEDRFASATAMLALIHNMGRITPVTAMSQKAASLIRSLRATTRADPTTAKTIEVSCDDLAAGIPAARHERNGNALRALMHHLVSRSIWTQKGRSLVGVLLIAVTGSVWLFSRAPATPAAPSAESQIEQYLQQARLAMDSDKLTEPEGDNAYFYYREVIKQVPDHEEAQQGLTEIANHYADLAEAAVDRFDYVNAKSYVHEGLAVEPDNPRLVALQQRTNAVKDVPTRLFKGIKSIFE